MYRKCVFCGWGRKEVTDAIKFFSLPNTPGLQKLRWLQALGEKCQNGVVRSKDSVCSLHFCTGKPSTDQTHIDFIPTRYLEENSVPSEIIKKSLRNQIATVKEPPAQKKVKKHLSLQEEARKPPVKRKPKAAKKTSKDIPEQSQPPTEGKPESKESPLTLKTTEPPTKKECVKVSPGKPSIKPVEAKESNSADSPKKPVMRQLPENFATSKVFVPKRRPIVKYRKVSLSLNKPITKTNTPEVTVSQSRPVIASVHLAKTNNSVAMEVVVDGDDSYSIPISG